MSTDTLAAHQILSKRFSYPAACDWYVPVVESMEEYAAQQVEQQTKQLREERDRAATLLLATYQIFCRANEFMYSDGSSISDATSRDAYHFTLNDGPEIERYLLEQGLITKEKMSNHEG